MGFLKFVIPFVGGALTAAAAGAVLQKKRDEKDNNTIEIDAEFEERLENDERSERKKEGE